MWHIICWQERDNPGLPGNSAWKSPILRDQETILLEIVTFFHARKGAALWKFLTRNFWSCEKALRVVSIF